MRSVSNYGLPFRDLGRDGEEGLLLGGDGEPLAADLGEVVGAVDEDAEPVEVVHPHGVVVRVGVEQDAQAQLRVGAVRPPQVPGTWQVLIAMLSILLCHPLTFSAALRASFADCLKWSALPS